MRRALLLAVATFAAACGGGPPAKAPVVSRAPSKPPGAILLALPGGGPPIVVAGAPSEVVRGRVRSRIDPDGGATRLREVSAEPAWSALSVPPWLGGGVVLAFEQGLALARPNGKLDPLLQGAVTSPSIGARELWTRARSTGDFVRVDLAKGEVTLEAPPIAAPILATWGATSATAGRAPSTAGPEFMTPDLGVALLELLGPVATRDGGKTWSPLDRDAVHGAFPYGAGPSRVIRDASGLSLGTDDRIAPVAPSGALGEATPVAKTLPPVPDVAAVRVEVVASHGVPIDEERILVADGPRLAVVRLDPLRIERVSRAHDLTRCDLRPSQVAGALANAICARHDDGVGGQLAVGAVFDGETGPRLVVERAFSYSTGHRFVSTGAIVLAATCSGASEGGVDLLSSTKVCVRDPAGALSEIPVSQLGSRRAVLPRSDGGVLILREDPSGKLELVALPSGATAATKPLRLLLPYLVNEVAAASVDEIAKNRFVLWRRVASSLSATIVEASSATLRVVEALPKTIVEEGATFGSAGLRAMLVKVGAAKEGDKKRLPIEASLTVDGGRTWTTDAWPDAARTLDVSPVARRVDCGIVGCRALGWSRIGWEPRVSIVDEVVDLGGAPAVPTPKEPPPRATAIAATCTSLGAPQTLDASAVPVAAQPSFGYYFGAAAYGSTSDVLLGHPPPKVPSGQVLVPARFVSHSVRGGLLSTGPVIGSWLDVGRTIVRFSTDLDPLGTVHESAPFPAPFAERMSAGRSDIDARALAPGRMMMALGCAFARCELYRVAAGSVPERIEIPNVHVTRVLGAREASGILFVMGLGMPRDMPPGKVSFDQVPFAALVTPSGVSMSFLARASWGNDAQIGATFDPLRGAFGVELSSPLPTWSAGTTYVLPIGADARPSAAFEVDRTSSIAISQPTMPCSSTFGGWSHGEGTSSIDVLLTVDGKPARTVHGRTGVVRTRFGPNGTCIERVTAFDGFGSFQLDPATRRGVLFALDDVGKHGKRVDLACKIAWQ